MKGSRSIPVSPYPWQSCIASGQLKEGEKLSGRSKLSPEYNVSPETIRRTLRLLADMKVVEVKEQSGVYVLSADNARRYLHNFADQTDIRGKQQQLKELLVRQEHLNRQMAALCRDILDETSQTPDALPNYYCRIPDDWPHSGTTVGALRFWQATGAPIVAIPPRPVLHRLTRSLCRAVRRRRGDLRGRRPRP